MSVRLCRVPECGGVMEEEEFPHCPVCAWREKEAKQTALLSAFDMMQAALESWVGVMDKMSQDPDDPVTQIREQYHGKRLAQSREAIEAAKKAREA